MTFNDLLLKQSVITKLVIKNDNGELPRELKVKLMRIRASYTKFRKNYDSEVQDFVNELMSDEYRTLINNNDRTEIEEQRLAELVSDLNSEYSIYIQQKLKETVSDIEDSFTEDEYNYIVEVNSTVTPEINGKQLSTEDFLELVYILFVK